MPVKIHREEKEREIRSEVSDGPTDSPQSRMLKESLKEFGVSWAKSMLGPFFGQSKHLVMCARNLRAPNRESSDWNCLQRQV